MQSVDLAPAGVVAAQGSAAESAIPCGESTVAADGGGRGRDPMEQQQQQQQRQQQQQKDDGLDSHLFSKLPTGPFLRVLELLPAQDRACSGRLACMDAWRHLSGVHHCTAHLSQPLPPHAVPWFERYGPEALKQLTLYNKLTQPMAAAAASGSAANLAAVWGMVRQGLHPELLQARHYYFGGSEAVLVQEGHAHLLPWLLDSGYPVDAYQTVKAAACYCDLPGLQAAWGLLQPTLHGREWREAVEAAAISCAAEDAIAKMDWLLQQQHQQQQMQGPLEPIVELSVAQAAAQTGDIVRLRWLLQRGCTFQALPDEVAGERGGSALPGAMRHAGLEVVEWLVREAGCQLPPPPGAGGAEEDGEDGLGQWPREATSREALAGAAAVSGDPGKLQWLRDRGLLPPDPQLIRHAVGMAARHGRIGALRFLLPLSPVARCTA